MDDEEENDSTGESPEGAAVFPMIPPELGVSPLFLGVLHAFIFLEGSDPAIVNDAAAEEAMEYIAGYLQRLQGAELRRVREDLVALTAFAKDQKWPKQQIRFLIDFLSNIGVE